MANNDIDHLQISEISGNCSVEEDDPLNLDTCRNFSRLIKTTLEEIEEKVERMLSTRRGVPRAFDPDDMDFLLKKIFVDLESSESLQINISRSLVKALVKFYRSSSPVKKQLGKVIIEYFLDFITKANYEYSHLVSVSLLSMLLIHEDPNLYIDCRKILKGLLGETSSSRLKLFKERPNTLREIFPIVIDLANKLCYDMALSMETTTSTGSLFADAHHFKTFSRLLCDTIQEPTRYAIPWEELRPFHNMFDQMLTKMGECLSNVEILLSVERIVDQNEIRSRGWIQYVAILKELSHISQLYEDATGRFWDLLESKKCSERFWDLLKSKKSSVCALIILHAQQSHHEWLFDHRNGSGTDTEFRICLATMMTHNKINNIQTPEIKDWEKGDFLGQGSYGLVHEGFAAQGFFFAAKETNKFPSEDSLITAQKEIDFLCQFNHENIIQYYGTEKADSTLYIFLELASKGSLDKLYKKYPLQDSQVSAYTRQILHGLKYLHDQSVIHRDLKCANILVNVNGTVKLADFGLAKVIECTIKSSHGTPWWMAPEVVNSSKGYNVKADIWSLGCTVLEMLTRQRPYPDLDRVQAMYKIGKGELPPIPDYLTSNSRDFILKCLQVDPNLRPTASQLLSHPFLKQ